MQERIVMKIEQVQNNKKVWVQWVAANIAGFLVTFVLLALLDGFLGTAATGDVIGHTIVFVVGGILFGVFQWLALRHHISLSGGNIICNTVACTVGLIGGFIGGYALAGPPFDFVGSVIMVGLLGGIVQWLVLRRQVSSAGWWFVASVAGFLLAAILGAAFLVLFADALDQVVGSGTTGFVAIVITYSLLVGLVAGSITGSVLPRLRQRPLPTQS
jgi:Na+/melibiose symporter-like transporter